MLSEHVEGERNNATLPPTDSYNKVHGFITRFNWWRSGKLLLPNVDVYEKNGELDVNE
jgi:hypothetical protein